MTLTKTPGTSAPIMYEIPSSIRLKPGDDVKVIAAQPGPAAAVHHVDGGHLAHGLHEDAVELRQQLRHQLGALGGGRDGIAEEVAAAREQRADGRGVGALHHQGPRLGQREVGVRDRSWASARRAVACRRAWPGSWSSKSPSGCEAVGLRAGLDAQAAGRAVLEVEDDGNEAGGGVDLGARLDAVAVAQASMQRPHPLQYSRLQVTVGADRWSCS